MFFLVVIVGLFHGLVVLPIILSWIGPPPYQKSIIGSRVGTPTGDLDKHGAPPEVVTMSSVDKPRLPSTENAANGHTVTANGVDGTENGHVGNGRSVEEGHDNPSF